MSDFVDDLHAVGRGRISPSYRSNSQQKRRQVCAVVFPNRGTTIAGECGGTGPPTFETVNV